MSETREPLRRFLDARAVPEKIYEGFLMHHMTHEVANILTGLVIAMDEAVIRINELSAEVDALKASRADPAGGTP